MTSLLWLTLFALGTAGAQTITTAPPEACHVTAPNGHTPPGEQPNAYHYGNGRLWTVLWLNGTVVFEPGGSGQVRADGSLLMKFPWWRATKGPLSVSGRRLDAPAPPLQAIIPRGYGATGFQVSTLVFPTEGCWQVTGEVAGDTLVFITRVRKLIPNGQP
jgi:hypothetical protein